jgi:hypothetical protein
VFYKFGKPVADKIIAEREGRLNGNSEWVNSEGEQQREADVPPFSEKVPKTF